METQFKKGQYVKNSIIRRQPVLDVMLVRSVSFQDGEEQCLCLGRDANSRPYEWWWPASELEPAAVP